MSMKKIDDVSHNNLCGGTGSGQMHPAGAEEKRGSCLREYSALPEHRKVVVMLRKMTNEEFLLFREYSVADYAEDLIRGEGLSREQALKNSENEFSAMLPDGPETAGQFLMAIEDAKNGKVVGWIWFFYEESAGVRQVFLYDLLIFQSERRKGYASAALDEMEQMAKAAGCTRSMLYVWEHNAPGFNLYQKCGYTAVEKSESGMYMKKDLTRGK